MEIEGFVVETDFASTKVVVGQHIFEFADEDILDIVDLIIPDGVDTAENTRPARIRLVQNACVLSVDPLDPSTHAFAFGQLPFALAVRKVPIQVFDSPTYTALEKSFLLEHNL